MKLRVYQILETNELFTYVENFIHVVWSSDTFEHLNNQYISVMCECSNIHNITTFHAGGINLSLEIKDPSFIFCGLMSIYDMRIA